jgi:hypothetical protein
METLIGKAIPGALAVALTLALALPATAMAEEVVPPENSAATQYTEAIPTGGGQKGTGGSGGHATPAAVLGADKAKKLESQGRKGREAAAVVAATAPSPPPAPNPAPQRSTPSSGGGSSKAGGKAKSDHGGGKSTQHSNGGANAPAAERLTVTHVEIPAGSSGLGEVLAQATGSSSSGQLGLLLPLLILAALAWALAFVWRQRQPAA